jgi:hypothetical protein
MLRVFLLIALLRLLASCEEPAVTPTHAPPAVTAEAGLCAAGTAAQVAFAQL